jgi:hypothetical protein
MYLLGEDYIKEYPILELAMDQMELEKIVEYLHVSTASEK